MSSKKPQTLSLAIFFTLIVLGVGGFIVYHWQQFYQTHFLPHILINQIDIGNLECDQALKLLQLSQFKDTDVITLAVKEQELASTSAQLGLTYDFPATLNQILKEQNQNSLLVRLSQFLFTPIQIQTQAQFSLDDDALKNMINELAQQTNQAGVIGQIALAQTGNQKSLTVQKGQNATVLNQEKAFNFIKTQLPTQRSFVFDPDEIVLQLTDTEIERLVNQAQKLIGRKIAFTADEIDNFSYTLNDIGLISILESSNSAQLKVRQQLVDEVTNLVARAPQEPELTLDVTSDKVLSFTPPQDGLTLNKDLFFQELDQGLNQLIDNDANARLEIALPLMVESPTKRLAQTNSLGINELIGFGESYYAHSIAGRVHNVALTAAKINNTLVAPGKEFSFNQTLGEVSADTGFKPGYVIQNGRSELSPGGGVCQVSTTLFRALLDAGLKVTLRLPHSYRVTYYELNNDPGFDATVYSGNIDLRFINDTNHYVLISTYTNSDDLYMNVRLYGTSDGRTTAITDYKKYDAVGAPATQYIIDPSLPSGAKKQIDWAVGGLKTIFTHTIYNADGSIRSQTKYPSTYQAWSAKFLVGP